MSRFYVIPAAARTALTSSAAFDGPRVTITEQLGADVWPLVRTTLEKSGAVFAVGTSMFEFEADQDAHAIVSGVLAAGQVMGAAGAAGYVPTPADLAADLVAQYGELRAPRGRRLRVLEPSAGTGRFVQAITRGLPVEWCDVTAVEMDARRARQIPADLATVVVDTFESYAARARKAGELFDVVVMNPPFSVPGRPTIWVDHLMEAWRLLAPGGRLVAIVPAAVLNKWRGGRVREAFELVQQHGGAELLERDAFKEESGVIVDTAAIWLDKPLSDVPVSGLVLNPLRYVFRAYTHDMAPVEVARPYLTRGAAETMPVQVWRDSWRGRDRVLRYGADCAVCTRPVWKFDDGENDPRGVLGDASGGWSLDPNEYDRTGLVVGLCALCGNDGDAYRRGLAMAERLWSTTSAALAAVQAPTVAAAPAVPVTVGAPTPDTAFALRRAAACSSNPWRSRIEARRSLSA